MNDAERRTQLAIDRTILAGDRTYAAWVRTGLAAVASGIGARTLLAGLVPVWLVGATASVLIGFSAFCFVAAVGRRRFSVAAAGADLQPLPFWLLASLNGFLVLIDMAALLGIWSG